MKKESKYAIVVVIAAAAIIAVGYAGVYAASGVSPPQTVVESWSMQHGTGSQIGVIDTGDMIILKNKEKVNIRSYVDGYLSGYSKFSGYGDVIIYDRGADMNPVIHRAILWLEYNGDQTWRAPSLKDYPTDLWTCTGGDIYDHLYGRLTLKKLGYNGTLSPSLDLDSLAETYPHSGFITMGDNNTGFDQPANTPGVNGLVTYEQIKSVAWIEVPWAGAFKMMFNGKMSVLDKWVPNTVPNIVASVLATIFSIIGISFIFDQFYYKKYRKELYEEMNAPAPSFPVEDDD